MGISGFRHVAAHAGGRRVHVFTALVLAVAALIGLPSERSRAAQPFSSLGIFTYPKAALATGHSVERTFNCPSDFPHSVNWRPSAGATAAALEVSVFNPLRGTDSATILFDNELLPAQERLTGIDMLCSTHWPPTVTDCGAEGQNVCLITPRLSGSGWQRSDWMAAYNNLDACDRGLSASDSVAVPSSTCLSDTRHAASGQADSWAAWALDQQAYHLAVNEPLNHVVQLKTHESYAAANDGYVFNPSQLVSLSDQLDAGVRGLELRPRWGIAPFRYLRLSHGTDSCAGCSPFDRPYTFAVQEIGAWLDRHPDQAIKLYIGQYDGGLEHIDYVLDPLRRYLGDRILGPREWCDYLLDPSREYTAADKQEFQAPSSHISTNCATFPSPTPGTDLFSPFRWPTLAEMRDLGKQVIVEEDAIHLDSDVTFGFDPFQPKSGRDPNSAFNFDARTCTRDGLAFLQGARGVENAAAVTHLEYLRHWVGVAEARAVGQTRFDLPNWPGYIYALRSEVPSFDSDNSDTSSRPFASRATSMEALMDCNVRHSMDMLLADNSFNGLLLPPLSGFADRREGLIWTWSHGDFGQPNTAARLGADGHFHSENMDRRLPVACADESTPGVFRFGEPLHWHNLLGNQWAITERAYTWNEAHAACRADFPDFMFGVPVNKYQLNQLRLVAGTSDVWLNFTNRTTGCTTNPRTCNWTIAAPPTITTGPRGEGRGPFLVTPATAVELFAYAATRDSRQPTFNWTWVRDNVPLTFIQAPSNNHGPFFTGSGLFGGTAVPITVTATDSTGFTGPAYYTWVLVRNTVAAISASKFGINSDPLGDATVALPAVANVSGTLAAQLRGTGVAMLAAIDGDPVGAPGGPAAESSPHYFAAAFARNPDATSATIADCTPFAATAWYVDATGTWARILDVSRRDDGCLMLSFGPNTSPPISALLNGHGLVFGVARDFSRPVTVATAISGARNYAFDAWAVEDVLVTLTASDGPHGSGVQQIEYSASGANSIASTVVRGSTVQIPISREGVTTLTFNALDRVNLPEHPQTVTIRLDKTPPLLLWGTPMPLPNASGWHNTNVSIPCTVSDTGSGVATVVPACPLALTTEGTSVSGQIVVTDVAGNPATFASPLVLIDKTPPGIRNVQVASVSRSGAVVTWTTTEPANTQVTGAVHVTTAALVVDHSVSLSGLQPNTTYSLQVRATDVADNVSAPVDVSFSTLATLLSLQVDGSNGYAEASHAADLNVTADWTVELWFKDEDPSGFNHDYVTLLTKGDRETNREVPFFASLGFKQVLVGLRAGSTDYALNFNLWSANVDPTRWHHLAASFDSTSRTLTLYLDGAPVARGLLSRRSSGNTAPITIGRGGPVAGKYLRGKVDDVRIWNIARSAADIAATYGSELDGDRPGLAANWHFDDGSGPTALDTTSHHHDATLSDGATFSSDVHP